MKSYYKEIVKEDLAITDDRFVISRQGYKVEISDEEGRLVPLIVIPSDIRVFIYLDTSGFSVFSPEVLEVCRSYISFMIKIYRNGTLSDRFEVLKLIARSIKEGLNLDEAILALIAKPEFVSGAKEVALFLVLFECEELSLEAYEQLDGLRGYSDNSNGYLNLYMMDEEFGPFNRDEVNVLTLEVDNCRLPLKYRVLLALCLCFGLRPIQLALMKRKDFIFDRRSGVYYLYVPRVKQRIRDRRSQFTARVLDKSTADLIISYLSSVDLSKYAVDVGELPFFIASGYSRLFMQGSPRCKGYWQGSVRTPKDFFVESGKESFIYHMTPGEIGKYMRRYISCLPVSPRTGRRFNLNVYRFRYTVGTMAVISGFSPEEVADLLDHSSVACVKHYFRLSPELFDLIEKASASRVEQVHFSAAWLGEGDLSANIFAKNIYESRGFSLVGKCGAAGVCFHEPAVACYGCKKFRPNEDFSAHRLALESLEQRRSSLSGDVAPVLIADIERSIEGCKAAIAFSTGDTEKLTLLYSSCGGYADEED